MKKSYLLLLFFCFGTVLNAQIINFSSSNFRSRLMQSGPAMQIAKNLAGNYFKIDSNNDTQIDVNEALQVSWLNVPVANINTLADLHYFANLTYLNCNDNLLTTLDATVCPNLVSLYCSNNDITSLNVDNLINLDYLECFNNSLSALPLNNLNALRYLSCHTNQIAVLNVQLLPSLQQLDCRNNQISSLQVVSLSNLFKLSCATNQLTTLNISGLNLQQLFCYENQISVLDLTGMQQLTQILCNDNLLTSLDFSDSPIVNILACNDNLLTSLNLENCTSLGTLDCSNNQIETLNLNNSIAQYGIFNLSNNNLNSLFVKNGRSHTNLNFSGNLELQYICTDTSQFTTIQNKLISYGNTGCEVNSYCSFTPGGIFYRVNGAVKFDGNTNGCGAEDIAFPYASFNIVNGANSGSFGLDSSGNYSYPMQSGTYTITPVLENPNYYTISPTTFTASFPSQSSPLLTNFCVTPNGIHNDLEIIIVPLEIARPGFDVDYKIIYKNKGNTMQSGNVNLLFEDNLIDFVVSNPQVSMQTTNNLNWSFSNLNPMESQSITVTFNLNSPMETPPLNSGDILSYIATVNGATDETPNNNFCPLKQNVINSLDPNDKTCIEGMTITPDKVGEYVHYVIRFENTGTANAENIVIQDLIDTTKFEVSTLLAVGGSHPFITRISNTNKVEFIFENIQLPFDDANNDGYVVFKIKTKPTLVLGNTFSNTASIYFDYNFPIVTNTYVTTVAALANQDFEFDTYFSLYPNPTKAVLNINTKDTIEMSSISIYNVLGQLMMVIPNAKETTSIDVSSLKVGNYFIKIVSDKGTTNTKFIKE